MLWLALALALVGNVIYHLGQRSIPKAANPAIATLAAYLVALALTAILLPFLIRQQPIAPAFRALNWSTVLVGVGIVGVEFGFLLAYRSGGLFSNAAVTVNTTLAVVLLGIGVLGFREPVSPARMAGVACCILGLWLINRPAH